MIQRRCQLITKGLCIAALLFLCSTSSSSGQDSSQNTTLQQLKDKLQNIEREMNDVQDQIKALEGAKAAPAAGTGLPPRKRRTTRGRSYAVACEGRPGNSSAVWILPA